MTRVAAPSGPLLLAALSLLHSAQRLALLLLTVITLLFFLLRLTGDPSLVLAGADATDVQIAAIRAEYGLDKPIWAQYFLYLFDLLRLDFGISLESGQPAAATVLKALPVTLQLSFLAMGLTIFICVPVGAWLGMRQQRPSRRLTNLVVFLLQATPGFVAGLFLIQLFSVELRLLPSIGRVGPETWVLPVLTLASFLVPKLIRVISANVAETLSADYVRTALAYGARPWTVLLRHALPNALLGAVALIGAQFAYLISGSVIVETMFAWPGLGWHLLQSTQTLDFPLVQALTLTIAVLVFSVNALTDLSFRFLDPRVRVGAP
ncbi:MAG: ABC transporter permease [Pseudomonadota bacterium]